MTSSKIKDGGQNLSPAFVHPPLLPPNPLQNTPFPSPFCSSGFTSRGRVRNDSFIDLVQDAIIVVLIYVEFRKIGTCQILMNLFSPYFPTPVIGAREWWSFRLFPLRELCATVPATSIFFATTIHQPGTSGPNVPPVCHQYIRWTTNVTPEYWMLDIILQDHPSTRSTNVHQSASAELQNPE